MYTVPKLFSRFVPYLLLSLLALLVACQDGSIALPNSSTGQSFSSSQIVGNLSADEIAAAAEGVVEGISARVITQGSRANLREGPGLEFAIVGKGAPNSEFNVLGQSSNGEWWQLCCTSNEFEEFEAGLTVWAASSTIEIIGDPDGVPASDTKLNDDLFARWDVDWECGSTRCDISECTASVEASVGENTGGQSLRLDHRVLWDETCFSEDEWIFEVNRFTGMERSGEQEDNFLYRYWVGPLVGEPNKIFELPDGKQVAASCDGPHTVEVEEGGGWTTVYTGNTCHDIRTGMLLTLTYEKRWLFTGEFEGQSYERAYFEDFELMEQNLIETNAQLSFLGE